MGSSPETTISQLPLVSPNRASFRSPSQPFSSSDEYDKSGRYSAFARSPDCRLLAGINVAEAKLTSWQAAKIDLRKQVCSAVRRSLTHEEWKKFVGENIAYIPTC